MANIVDWSLNDLALRKKLLQLSKPNLIKASKYKKVSYGGKKKDIIDRILKANKFKKHNKSNRKVTKKKNISNIKKLHVDNMLPDPPTTKIKVRPRKVDVKQRKLDLVNGYCRIDAIIPVAIIEICFMYFQLSDEWNTQCICIGKHVSIEGIGDICVNTCNNIIKKTQSVFGRNIVKSGYHVWKLKILKYNDTYRKENMIIGIIPHKYCEDFFDKDFTFSFHSVGFIGSEGAYDDWQYGKRLQNGDIVEMHFDMTNLTVKYIINGHDYGICFDNYDIAKDTAYTLAITIVGQGSSIQILDYHSVDIM